MLGPNPQIAGPGPLPADFLTPDSRVAVPLICVVFKLKCNNLVSSTPCHEQGSNL